MFHSNSGLFFGRTASGDVRLLKLPKNSSVPPGEFPKVDGEYPEAEMDMTLEKHSWCSAIASVCSVGETGETYEKAKSFHGV